MPSSWRYLVSGADRLGPLRIVGRQHDVAARLACSGQGVIVAEVAIALISRIAWCLSTAEQNGRAKNED